MSHVRIPVSPSKMMTRALRTGGEIRSRSHLTAFAPQCQSERNDQILVINHNQDFRATGHRVPFPNADFPSANSSSVSCLYLSSATFFGSNPNPSAIP